jgi:hypothetical protein
MIVKLFVHLLFSREHAAGVVNLKLFSFLVLGSKAVTDGAEMRASEREMFSPPSLDTQLLN